MRTTGMRQQVAGIELRVDQSWLLVQAALAEESRLELEGVLQGAGSGAGVVR